MKGYAWSCRCSVSKELNQLVASRPQVSPGAGSSRAKGQRTNTPWAVSAHAPPRRRRDILCAVLAVGLGCGSPGCGTLVGYGVGHAIDGSRFTEVPEPYRESLPSMVGRVVRATVERHQAVEGKLTGVEDPPGGDLVCFIRSERQTSMPGRETRVDTVAVASILAMQVARDSHTYRDVGVFAGLVTDATAICLIAAMSGRVGEAASK
jgi:hypothetical protein